MDIGSIISLLAAVVFTIVSILLSGELGGFFDLASIMITIGGSVAASFIAYSVPSAITGIKAAKFAFTKSKTELQGIIQSIVDLANESRRNGLLSLEEKMTSIDNSFLKNAVSLIVDGTEPEMIRSILELDISCMLERHRKVYGYWEKMAELGPAWGMIGTLVGLVNMLRDMGDPSTIGLSMAVAIITTFYGSIIANLIASPIASRLKLKSEEEALVHEMIIEGIISVQAGENPRIVENKLKSFLPVNLRENLVVEEDKIDG